MGKLYNRAKMTVQSAPGVNNVTLGSALAGHQSFAASGAAAGDVVSYVIEDGIDWEIGQGTLSGTPVSTLARTSVTQSSNAGNKITAGAGAIVYIAPIAADLQQAGLQVDVTAIASGTNKRVLYDNGNKLGEASALIYDSSNSRLGINAATPAVTLDISATDALRVPAGTIAQRPTGSAGYIRFNSDYSTFEGYNGSTWTSVGGGATGGGSDQVFYLNGQTVNNDYTIPSTSNAGTFGPVTVGGTATVTISSGATWTIV